MVFYQPTLAGILALILVGCASPEKKKTAVAAPEAACLVGEHMLQTTLYFGLSRPYGREITDNEWRQFVDKDVTPRFRNGLTEYHAKGQWMNAAGDVIHEPAKTVMLIHSRDATSSRKVDELRTLYKTRFAQESVMRIDQIVCAAN